MKINKSFAKKVPWGIIIHAVIIWVALALGYNSYKEVMREIDPLTRAARESIKATFPWAVLAFSGLYFILSTRRKTGEILLSFSRYVYVILICAFLFNLFYVAKGKDILIPLNLSITYLAILLLLCRQLSKIKMNAQDWLPPIIYKYIIDSQLKSQSCNKKMSSAPFIIAFMCLLAICAILLILGAEKTAEQLANVAYFLLVLGVGIEMYQLVKGEERDEKE